ncbi:MAG: hypothetical protein ABIR62_09700 [Dokdonella sp.]|uniref:hypothetical protein n=1 Tax=Dokdonella sp. TaxID=2291710 RepID=UPI0032646826
MRTVLYAALLATATLCGTAQAGSLLDLAVVDRDTGATLDTYADHGKLYVAGTPGHRYSVRMTNRSGGRVLAVLSVDGVNAVSGETANPDQTGYVLDAWASTEIGGWRKNVDEVAQFNFTALPNSYAARTGRPANVGVIGVAVFTEKQPVWREREQDKVARDDRPAAAPAPAPAQDMANRAEAQSESQPGTATGAARPSATAAPDAMARREAKSTERLGTGHGAREYAHVDTTTFERASRRPAETVAVWYDSTANLVAQGIIPRPIAKANPQPFPGSFVADPPSR